MPSFTLNLPGIVRVEDTHTYKGHPATVLYIFDQAVAYFVGKDNYLSNQDWEECIQLHLARFFAEKVMERFPDEWVSEHPSGRELYSQRPRTIEFIEERPDSE